MYGFAGCWVICVLRSAPVPNARVALQKQLWRPPADLVYRVVRQRHDIEIAVRALLNAGRRAEPLANLQRLALLPQPPARCSNGAVGLPVWILDARVHEMKGNSKTAMREDAGSRP